MEKAEGPSMVNEVLLSRFKKAPSIVVYDNACKAATYAISRYPKFYADTLFLVDRMHFYGHINCSPVYDANFY